MPRGPIFASQSTMGVTPSDCNDMDIDNNQTSLAPAQLSNTLLQAGKAKRQVEREERSRNGNIVPRAQHKVGKKLDSLTHKLVIERCGVNANGESCAVYYCIGCDENSRNNARARSLTHAYKCLVSGTNQQLGWEMC